MPFKISGVELVRRLRARAPEYRTMAEHCTQHAEEIKKKISELASIAGHDKMQMMSDPDAVWQSRAESCNTRADDLIWLSDSIAQAETHEITIEEMFSLGMIGTIGAGLLMSDGNE